MKIVNQYSETDVTCFVIQSNAGSAYVDMVDMTLWLRENCRGKWRRSSQVLNSCFLVDVYDENDAMLLKLTFA